MFTSGVKEIDLNIKEKKKSQCMGEHWNRLSREAVDSLILEVVDVGLDEALCNVVNVEVGSVSNRTRD